MFGLDWDLYLYSAAMVQVMDFYKEIKSVNQ